MYALQGPVTAGSLHISSNIGKGAECTKVQKATKSKNQVKEI